MPSSQRPTIITVTEILTRDTRDGSADYTPPSVDELVHPGELITNYSSIWKPKLDEPSVVWGMDGSGEGPGFRAPLTAGVAEFEMGGGSDMVEKKGWKSGKRGSLRSRVRRVVRVLTHPWQLAARLA